MLLEFKDLAIRSATVDDTNQLGELQFSVDYEMTREDFVDFAKR